MRLRERSFAEFALCLMISGIVCLVVVVLLYGNMAARVLRTEFTLMAMLCAGLSLAITMFDTVKAAMLTLLLIGEYAALSIVSGRMSVDLELRVWDLIHLQLNLRQARMLFPAALITSCVAFILCSLIVGVLLRRGKNEPCITEVVPGTDTLPRYPVRPNAEPVLSREELRFLLGKDEQMAVKE
jgi:hypothetical protein